MENDTTTPTAACLLIGDELLSGRIQDANAHHLAKRLDARGIALLEIRVVPDDHREIVTGLRQLRAKADIVFTSGGIGPTHDDITADAVADALGRPIGEREDALQILRTHYSARGEDITDARRRMARVPDGAALIPNSVSGAPGFQIDGVYVMAGVPAIFRAMLGVVEDELPEGEAEHVFTVTGEAKESALAPGLQDLQAALKGLAIGSYPDASGRGGPLSIVLRSRHRPTAAHAAEAVRGLFAAQHAEAVIEEG